MSKTLLLADDSVVIQKLVGLSFANENVEIITTDNGDDAIAKAREIVPDLVLADVVMPGMSGYEVCEAIKQDPALRHIPVLLLTGTFEAFDENQAAEAGADGQITKPFEAQSLVERVTSFMNAPPAPPAQEPVAAAAANEPIDVSATTSGTDFFEAGGTTLSPLEASLESAFDATDPLTPADEATDAVSASFVGQGAPEHPSSDNAASDPGASDHGLSGNGLSGNGAPDNGVIIGDAMPLAPPVVPQPPGEAIASPPPLPESPPSLPPAAESPLAPPQSSAAPPSPYAPPGFAEEDATIVAPLSAGSNRNDDPLAGLDDEFGMDISIGSDAAVPASALDLDSALNSVSGEQEATIFVADDDVNAQTSPDMGRPVAAPPSTDARDDLTIHAPTAGIDSDASLAWSPATPVGGDVPRPVEDAGATVVANLDDDLYTNPPAAPGAPALGSLNLGPSSVAPEDLDFAFDVSEQASVEDLGDPLEQSFSSLMDISESQLIADATPSTPGGEEIAAGYDVSSSDLATADAPLPPSHSPLVSPSDSSSSMLGASSEASETPPAPETVPLAELVTPSPEPVAADYSTGYTAPESVEVAAEPAESFEEAFNVGLAQAVSETIGDASDEPYDQEEPLELGTIEQERAQENDATSARISDLSPMMEQRIHETLEKVAWEAFSDLSESIVKQVIGRVEQIAWEVIPQMAETLVREEIRKMKGEDD